MASPTVNIRNDHFTSEFEINDSPPEARKMLTKGFIQEEISRFSGAAISTRGCYINKKEAGQGSQTDKGRPLYLFLQGPTKHCIQLAIQKIHEIIRHDIASALNRANRSKCAFERLYVGLDGVPASFDLRGKIIGQNASNFAFIRSESGAAVTLCGGQGPEDEPLHILLEHSSQEGLNSAKVLTANLIETLTQEFHQIQFNQQISLPPAHPGAPPQLQVHQQTHQVNGPAMQINVPTSQMNYLPMQLTGLPPTQVNIPSSQLSVAPMQMSAPPGQMSVVPSHMAASPAQAQPQPSMVTQMSMPPTTGNPLMRQQPVQNNSNMVVSSGPTPPSVHNYHPMEPLAGHTIQVNIPPPGMHIPQRVGPMIPPAVPSGGGAYVSAENQMAYQAPAPAPATPHMMVATTSNVQTERLPGPESAPPLQMQMNVPPPAVHVAFHSAANSEQVHSTAERPRKRRFDEVVWEDKGQSQQQTVSANGPTSYVGRNPHAGAQGTPADAANFKKVPHWSANEIHTKGATGEMPLNPLPKPDMSPAAHQVKSHADVTTMPNVQKTLWSEHKVEIQEYHSNSLQPHEENKQGKVPYYQITSSSGPNCTTSPGSNNMLHPSFISPGGLILTEVPQPQSTQQSGPPAKLQSMVIHHNNPPNRMQPMLLAPHSVQHVMLPANANTVQSIGFNSSNTNIQSGAGFSNSPTFQQGPMPPQRIGRGVLNIIQSDGFTCNSMLGRGPMQLEGSHSIQAQMVSGEGQQRTFSSSDMQYGTVVTMNVQPSMMPSSMVQGGMHFVTSNQTQQLQPLNAYANSNVFVQQHDAPATGHSMQLAAGQTTLQCTNVPPPNMVNRYEPPTQLVQNYSVWPGNT